MKTPQEILLDNELVITMMNVHHYVPHKDHGNFRQVVAALQQINPKAVYQTDCSGCMLEIGRMAQIHLDAYKATLANETATFHKFPKQDLPVYQATGEGEITAIEIVKMPEDTPKEYLIQMVKKHKGRKPGSKNKPK